MKYLFCILLLAALLRFWNLASNPPGLTWDETALGYNAYSILSTARDEYGSFLPINLKSFGDYKPALYTYIDIPFIALFGLNEWAVRFPSALFGILAVFGVYLLINQLFKQKSLALLAAFFLAISPWHIQFSRPAFEASMALTFNIFGAYFFLKGFERKKYFIFSAIIFGFSILTYQASKLFVPILVLTLFTVFRSRYKFSDLKIPVFILGLFLLLIGWTFLSGQTSRLATINFFAYQRSAETIEQIANEEMLNKSDFRFQILHGEWWAYVRGLFERYLLYFSPKMLFIEGETSQRHKVPDLGIVYYFSIILIPLGILYLLKKRNNASKFLLIWLLLAPIPAVLARDLINILRALNMVIPIAVLEAVGFYQVLIFTKSLKKQLRILVISLIVLFMLANFLIYIDRYFIHAPKEYSRYWLYGYKEAFDFINKQTVSYDKIVISDVYGQPYIYYLFATKYQPSNFQKQSLLDQPTVDVGTVRKIDNIEFRHIYWPNDRNLKNSLFIGTPDELPDQDILPFAEYKTLKQINFLNGETAFKIIETE